MSKDYYLVPAISNSGMSSINPEQGGTPLRYKTYVIDRLGEEKESLALQNGKLIHLYVEDPQAFVVSDVDKPVEMLASWVEEVAECVTLQTSLEELQEIALSKRGDRYKSVKDEVKLWLKFKEGYDYLIHLLNKSDLICIRSETKTLLDSCINSLRNHKEAKRLLFDGSDMYGDESENELAIYWNELVQDVSLPCKALLDRVNFYYTEKKIEIVDLKTTSKPVSLFSQSFEFWRYYRQMSWYKHALKQYIDTTGYEVVVYMVVVETVGVYETKVFEVQQDWFDKGDAEFKDLLNRIAKATKEESWESQGIEKL